MTEDLLHRHAQLRADLDAAYAAWPWDADHIEHLAGALLALEMHLARLPQGASALGLPAEPGPL